MTTARGKRLFCFGYGFSACALGALLGPDGWTLAGTCRTPEGCRALAEQGVEAVPFSREAPLPDPVQKLAGATHVLLSIPPDAEGDPALDRHGAAIAAIEGLEWVGYLSTTGVYGDTGGAWVDESATPAPTGARSERRVEAERSWLALGEDHGLAVHVFRLAGIYGPGRNALAAVKRGTAKRIARPGQVFSRIHVADIAQVLAASIAKPRAGAIYNVCDDEPAPAADVVEHACNLLGVAPLPLTPLKEADLSPMARSFYADNRRVSNARIKSELGVTLRYPNYRAGLSALLAEEAGSLSA
ncbi:MAG: SDR family oxidoreductase [Rhodospirillales bacterium]|nr:SDR family oxidoreductase [Rhodospirillales bacterium]